MNKNTFGYTVSWMDSNWEVSGVSSAVDTRLQGLDRVVVIIVWVCGCTVGV